MQNCANIWESVPKDKKVWVSVQKSFYGQYGAAHNEEYLFKVKTTIRAGFSTKFAPGSSSLKFIKLGFERFGSANY